MDLESAIRDAADYCINNGYIAEFLKKNISEVVNMLTKEFNLETAKQVWQEEAREEGIEEGIEKGRALSAVKISKELLAMGMPIEQIARATGLSIEEIIALQKE